MSYELPAPQPPAEMDRQIAPVTFPEAGANDYTWHPVAQFAPNTEADRLSQEAVRRLEDSPIHIGRKVDLLLTSLRLKPVSLLGFQSPIWQAGEVPRPVPEEKYSQVVDEARALGLYVYASERTVNILQGAVDKGGATAEQVAAMRAEYGSEPMMTFRSIAVGRSEQDIIRLAEAEAADDVRTEGRLLGYPETAVEAYAAGRSVQPFAFEAFKRDPVVRTFVNFKVSPENAEAELAVARQWGEAVQQVSPKIYSEAMSVS